MPDRFSHEVTASSKRTGATDGHDIASQVQTANQRNSLLGKLDRGVSILRYYRKSQLLRRAVQLAVPGFCRSTVSALPAEEPLRVRGAGLAGLRSIASTRSLRSNSSVSRVCKDLQSGKFTLLQQTRDLGSPVDWHGKSKAHPSRLWSFQLHYQEYLLDLAIASSANEFNPWPTIWQTIESWIEGNPLEKASIRGNAWHPYCISRRVPVWAQLFAISEPPLELRERVLLSLATQAEVLSKNLEFDLGGNHLLENLHALVLAGVVLEGERSKRWFKLAARHLNTQLRTQILPHGEHFERTPMYHCQVLGNLLQVLALTTHVDELRSFSCRSTATRMYEFLQSIIHPDGEIPLFGDSCWGEAHDVQEIAKLATLAQLQQPEQVEAKPAACGPYWTWRNGNDALIFDAGAVGADALPAHAHCDLLGFEASIAGQRWFVDSGLYDYQDSAMRAYCRSSVAHNMVTVDLENCCDVWSRFRMGRRGRPLKLDWGQEGDFAWCHASHDGYRHLGIPELSRLIVAHSAGTWACLEHASKSAGNSLVGRLHLAPAVEVLKLESDRVLLVAGNIQRWLFVTPKVTIEVSDGWYCDRFGQRTPTQTISYRPRNSSADAPPFGWSLSPAEHSAVSLSTDGAASCQVRVTTDGTSQLFSRQFHY